jgi:FkbM family methyltransferase
VAAGHVARKNAHLLAIEADPALACLLQKTVSHPQNVDLEISLLCAAVSDQIGIGTLLIANRGRASNSLASCGHRSQAGGTRCKQVVPTVTLDSLLAHFPAPELLKVDVEGAEALVLQGATTLLRDHRPIIYIEVGTEQSELVCNILQGHSYLLFNGDSNDGIPSKECYYNTLAIPSEQGVTNATYPSQNHATHR